VRLLVTGATGFVGRHLIAALADRHEIAAIARRTPAGADDRVRWIEQDLAAGLDREALPGAVDAVVHLAQSKRYREFPDGAQDIFAVNIASTFALLEYARLAGASHFVFTSSGGVYGYGDDPLAESHPVSPIDFYLRSKYAAELLVANYQSLLTTVVLRLFFVYGAGQRQMLIPTLAARVTGGEPVVVRGDPGVRINPVHVDDAVRVFEPALALERSGVYNVAGPEAVTLTELVEALGRAAGREPSVSHDMSSPPTGDLVADTALMREVLGVEPRVSLADGLREVVREAAARAS
jgi:UDP-glucose 4-epimerase